MFGIKESKLSRKGRFTTMMTVPIAFLLVIFTENNTGSMLIVFTCGLFLGSILAISNRKLKLTWGDSYFQDDKK